MVMLPVGRAPRALLPPTPCGPATRAAAAATPSPGGGTPSRIHRSVSAPESELGLTCAGHNVQVASQGVVTSIRVPRFAFEQRKRAVETLVRLVDAKQTPPNLFTATILMF